MIIVPLIRELYILFNDAPHASTACRIDSFCREYSAPSVRPGCSYPLPLHRPDDRFSHLLAIVT
jgi:hypothetical protein